ncbi:MAG: ABC transporter ATP-binding protein [Bacteroidales bacterium]|nr:ABC transporter ATP-binding protein [Bacteroidales bacterium]
MTQAVIELKNLEIGYTSNKRKTALLPLLNLCLNKALLVALIGSNGVGKSTLLRTISGLQVPLNGEVFIKGKPAKMLSRAALARLISLVLTDQPDEFYLKTEDVIAAGRYPYSNFWARLTAKDNEVIHQSMEDTGITHLKGRQLIHLSDGERQKVMIAKALAQDTPIILLDEPTAFLDYPSKIELMRLLQQLVHDQQKTILFSSHDLDLVLRSSDRVWLMAKSKGIIDDLPEQLVMDGHINAFFDTSSLSFDTLQGYFKPVSSEKLPLRNRISDPLLSKWVTNALVRKGFEVNKKSDNYSGQISFEAERFVWEFKGEIRYFNALTELLDHLTNKL